MHIDGKLAWLDHHAGWLMLAGCLLLCIGGGENWQYRLWRESWFAATKRPYFEHLPPSTARRLAQRVITGGITGSTVDAESIAIRGWVGTEDPGIRPRRVTALIDGVAAGSTDELRTDVRDPGLGRHDFIADDWELKVPLRGVASGKHVITLSVQCSPPVETQLPAELALTISPRS